MLKLHYITSNNVKKKIALTACIKQNYFKLNSYGGIKPDIKQNIHKQHIVHKISCNNITRADSEVRDLTPPSY